MNFATQHFLRFDKIDLEVYLENVKFPQKPIHKLGLFFKGKHFLVDLFLEVLETRADTASTPQVTKPVATIQHTEELRRKVEITHLRALAPDSCFSVQI